MLLRSLKLLLFLQENFETKTKNAKAYKHFVYFVFFFVWVIQKRYSLKYFATLHTFIKNKILTIRKQFCTNIFDYSCPKLPLMQEIVRAKIQWLKGFV